MYKYTVVYYIDALNVAYSDGQPWGGAEINDSRCIYNLKDLKLNITNIFLLKTISNQKYI